MGRYLIDCDICGGRINRYIYNHYSCFHCHRLMCRKCNKGAICAACLESVPTNIQESCMEVKKLTRTVISIPTYLMLIPFLITGILVFLGVEDATDNVYYIIFIGLPMMAGMMVIIPTLIYRRIKFKNWYKENRHFLPSYDVRFFRPEFP